MFWQLGSDSSQIWHLVVLFLKNLRLRMNFNVDLRLWIFRKIEILRIEETW